MRSHTSIILCILVTFTIFCRNESISISKGYQGKTITVPLNTELLITLQSNPSTGFGWEILSIDSGKIQFEERSFFPYDSLPGSSGSEHIRFTTKKKGTSLLKLGYLRSWEGSDSMTDSFSVFIEVK